MYNIYSKMVKKETLSSPKRRLKIIQAVVAVHLAVIFLPLSYFLLTDYLRNRKKKDTIVVRLVEIPKEVTAKTVKKSGTRRQVQKPKKPIVKKKQITKPSVEPKFKKPDIKKTQPKKTAKEPLPKRTVSTAKKVQPKTYTPPSPPDDLEIIKTEDLKRVPAHEQETADDNDDEVGATYAEQLVGVIYKLWNPPSNQLLNGRNPRVHIKIRMNRYGRVLQAEIVQKSGFKPMDYSAEELLRNLKQLPPPPPAEPTEIEFVLVPQK